MTEKTTKTPSSDQNGGSSKDQTTVAGSKGRNETRPAPKDAVVTASETAKDSSPRSSADPGGRGANTATGKQASAQATSGTAQVPTDKKPAASAAAKDSLNETAKDSSPRSSPDPDGRGAKTPPPPPPSGASPKKSSPVPLVVLALVVLLLAGGLWYQHDSSQQHIQRIESQIQSSAEQARQAQQKAQQALDALAQQRETISGLRADLQESIAELDGLNSAFQTITDRGSDLVLLNDIDHLVMIAQQQLQLNGNVANAIISLETAQAQLARANRPALASLQQTINGDLDRLRAATTVDIALLSARLDELAGLVVQAPLLVPDDAVPDAGRQARISSEPNGRSTDSQASNSADDQWWERALSRTRHWTADTFKSLRHDLGAFVSVRRVDDAAALLISPDQASRFRDSLRQRIMTAQLALMMDQSLIWDTETDALLKAVESRFDPQSSLTRQAIRIARDVADTAIDTPLPDVTNSIKALEALNEQIGRRAAPGQNQSGAVGESANEQVEPSVPDVQAQPDAAASDDMDTSASDDTAAPDSDDMVSDGAESDGIADEPEAKQG